MLKKGGDTLSMALTDQRKARVYAQFSIPKIDKSFYAQLVEATGNPVFKTKNIRGLGSIFRYKEGC